jgi:hypothetical protein
VQSFARERACEYVPCLPCLATRLLGLAKAVALRCFSVLEGKENQKEMFDEIVRCPYCVEGGEFRPMLQRSTQRFLCPACGHMSIPADPRAKCSCNRCREMNELALRQRTAEETRRRMMSDVPARQVS